MPAPAPAAIRRPPWRLALPVIIVLAFGAIFVFAERGPIAASLARNWLARLGVPARISVRRLSLTGLSGSVSLGDPAHPALTIERLDAGYAIAWPWDAGGLGVRTRSAVMIHPRLSLALTGHGPDLAPLQPLIDWARRQPPGALPDITVQDGQASLAGPGGHLTLTGSLRFTHGRVDAVLAHLAPFQLSQGNWRADGAGGPLTARRTGDRLGTRIGLGPLRIEGPGLTAEATGVSASADLPAALTAGPVMLAVESGGLAVRQAALGLSGGQAAARFAGDLTMRAGALAWAGQGSGEVRASAIAAGAAKASATSVNFTLTRLRAEWAGGAARLRGAGAVSLSTHAATRDGEANLSGRNLALRGLDMAWGKGGVTLAGTVAGGLSGRASLTARAATRLTAGLAGQPDMRAAANRALAQFSFAASGMAATFDATGPRLVLAGPVRVVSRSGARLAFDPLPGLVLTSHGASGAARLSLAGGGMATAQATFSALKVSPGRVTARLAGSADLTGKAFGVAHLAVSGQLSGSGGVYALILAGCAQERFTPPKAQAVAVRVCPGAGPAVRIGPSGWAANLGIALDGPASIGGVRLDGAAGSLALQGGGRALLAGNLVLDRARVADGSPSPRFQPLLLDGRAAIASGEARGQIIASTPSGRRLGALAFRQALAGGGAATVVADGLVFAPGGFQPGDLTPLAAGLRQVRGDVRFSGRATWKGLGDGLVSSGRLVLDGLDLSTPLGPAKGARGDIAFTSLAPARTEPDQKLTIASIGAVVPVTELAVRFSLSPKALAVSGAQASVAHGIVTLGSTEIPFGAGGGPIQATVGLEHVNIGEIIAATSLAQQVKLQAVVNGAIPLTFAASGLTIHDGHLEAIKPGRLSIARTALGAPAPGAPAPAAVPASGQSQLAQDFAYQALEDLAFDELSARLDTRAGDRLGVLFHIRGRHDPATPVRARLPLLDVLRGKAFAKPLPLPSGTPINLTLDTSLNFGELVRQLRDEWRAMTAGSRAVQGPKASLPAMRMEKP